MPLVRIDIPAGKSAAVRNAIAGVVYEAMLETLKVPKDDRFIVISEHASTNLSLDPTYLGITRTKDAIVIQVTLNEGRTVDAKKGFYEAVANGLHASVGMRREDVFISLVEVKKENWSFGNGLAQYA